MKNTAIRKIDQRYSKRTTAIGDSAAYTSTVSAAHVADTTIHFTEASIDHTNILNIGTVPHGTIDAHIADTTIHFLEGAIDHTNILNIGTNTHAQIDTHIAGTAQHGTLLHQHVDVNTTGIGEGSVLAWATATSTWIVAAAAGGTLTPHGLGEHTNVATATPNDGDLLRYNASGTTWEPVHPWGTPFYEPSAGSAFYMWKAVTDVGTALKTVYDNVTYVVYFDLMGHTGPGGGFGTSGFLVNEWDGTSYHELAIPVGSGTVTLRLQDHTGGSPADQLDVYTSSTVPTDMYFRIMVVE